MKVLISTIGSRGDVQPIVALARELRALGHEASLCVPPNFKDWVESFGLRCFPIGPDVKNFAGAANPSKPFKPSAEQRRQLAAGTVRTQFQVLPEAARGCDLIVGATALQIAARSIAQTLGIPYVFVAYCPAVFPSLDHPPPPKLGSPPRQRRLSIHRVRTSPSRQRRRIRLLWKENERSFDEVFLAPLNDERAQLGLAPVNGVRRHVFTDRPWLAADRTLAPASSRSRMQIVQTGAWFLPDESALPDDLESFLANGEPPVYFGFGSMRASDPGRLLIEAARASGLRSILSRGWGNLDLIDTGADCISIGDVNHERLFARVAAVVHHGGAGTATAAAKAGRPQVIVPHMFDQFYFAERVQKLGAGVACAHRELLTVNALTFALRQCSRPEMKARAEALARRIALDGAKIAAQQLAGEFGRGRKGG